MAELKTKKNDASVEDFLNSVENERRRQDSFKVLELMKEVTQEEPTMWGPSIVGFGDYHYKYPTGREANWFKAGFSPRKTSLTLYIMDGFEHYDSLLSKLGKHSTGKSCLYIKKLDDINMDALKALVQASVTHISQPEESTS